ncbi:MAG: hypothetical protein V7676_13310 [Parasphingorhabdus sp.]|uniref:hypothetical protein n=1 Tax=Parasphingorhabdus sp. TaxID=2709688 RepID=UPI0030030F40
MTDDKKGPEDKGTDHIDAGEKNDKWSTGVKVGAAVGSAALAAALIYAGRHKMRTLDEFKTPKPKPGTRYENEPVDDADEEGAE